MMKAPTCISGADVHKLKVESIVRSNFYSTYVHAEPMSMVSLIV